MITLGNLPRSWRQSLNFALTACFKVANLGNRPPEILIMVRDSLALAIGSAYLALWSVSGSIAF
jgi:hypothetical protein